MDTRVDIDNQPSPSLSSTSFPLSSDSRRSSSYKRQSVHRIDRLGSLSGQTLNSIATSSSSPSSPFLGNMGPNGHSNAPSLSNPAGRRESLYSAAPSIWDREPIWIALYFSFNLALTLYNKIALNVFPYPWSLTAIHSLCAAIGCYIAEKQGYFTSSVKLGSKENIILFAFSTLYTINIAVSNVSLNLVSVPLHQVIRSLTPLFTIAISLIFFNKSFLLLTYLSLVPVILGIALATHGDYSCTTLGFCLTVLSALLASIKGVTTNRILVGSLKFHPLEFLMRMSPLSFAQCLVFSLLSGEMTQIYDGTANTGTLDRSVWTTILFNGAVAFGLNVVSFTANKKAGALTMDVAANVKQVLTIVLAVFVFDLHINFVNFVGIALTIAGGAFYSYVEYSNKGKLATSPSSASNGVGNVVDEKIRLSNRGRIV